MHKSKINKISLAVCLAFMPIYGLAAGLGKLSVDSGLGEPLKAQIDLISVTPDELSTLSASIASEEAYAIQGITRLGVHSSIKVEIAKKPDGSPVLKLRSQQPIDDPYLDMLIQVDWSSGRLLREYTILLDPPGYQQAINDSPLSRSVFNPAYVPGQDNAATASAGANGDAYEVKPRTEVKPRIVEKEKRKQKSTADSANESDTQHETDYAFSQTDEVVTKRGDTLYSIAREMQLEGVSIDQMLVGLFNTNKSAFAEGNMNRLKIGQIIKVPSQQELTALTKQQASKEVKVHSANWNAYRNSLAESVLVAEAAEGADSRQSASGKIVSAQDQAAPVKSGPQDVVKLSAGGTVAGQGAGKAGAESDAKILALQEEATAREKALKESQERTAALEAQLADMQKLLTLKNQSLADVQKNAADSIKPQQSQQPESADAANAQSNTEATAATPASAATPQDAAATDVKQEAANSDKKTAVTKVSVQPEPEEEPSFFTALLESIDLFMLAGAGGLTLLGAGWLYMRNKRRKDLDSFERGILTSGGLRANTVFGNTTGNATSSADTSFLTDFAQSADGGMIDTTDVDPIAEAEVYMAYGRDAQAEEILKEAISKEPNRYELHLKLLEMYAARKDASAFETIAGELYTILGADDPVWAQVAALGITVEPDNPLYDTSRIPAATAVASTSSKSEANAVEADISKDLDFSFDRPVEEAAGAVAESGDQVAMVQEQSQSVEFEQNSFDTGGDDQSNMDSVPVFSAPENIDSAAEKKTTLESKPATDNSMDFDFPDIGSFNLDTGDQSNAGEPAEPASAIAEAAETVPVFEMPASDAVEEIQFTATAPEPTEAEESSALSSLDFNFSAETVEEMSKPDVVAGSSDLSFEAFTDTSNAPEQENSESSALNAMDFNFEGFGAPEAETNDVKQTSALEGISLDFDAEDASTAQTETKVEEISFDFPLADESESDSQNMETGVAVEATNQAANFDFSTISLDLSGVQPQAAAELEVAESVAAATVEVENPDVDIKLDLVKVYIDMEDIEGARDLLDEVLKEGGPQQRMKAEQLRASLA